MLVSPTLQPSADSPEVFDAPIHDSNDIDWKIGLGVGLGIGLPSLILASLTAWLQRKSHRTSGSPRIHEAVKTGTQDAAHNPRRGWLQRVLVNLSRHATHSSGAGSGGGEKVLQPTTGNLASIPAADQDASPSGAQTAVSRTEVQP